jgi:hypothetical protein
MQQNQNTPAVQTTAPAVPAGNPFQRMQSEHLNAGTVAIEAERAIAEAQGKLIIAKRFPRNEAEAFDRVMASCGRPSLANQAFYAFPRGGETVSGPSIRLAEELARAWGNIDYGIRELSQKQGESEMEAYCWDLQTNTFSSQKFSVKHERHTRQGVRKLTDPRDIYELTANQGARRLRARILAVLPPDLVDAAEDACRATLNAATAGVPLSERINRAVAALANVKVTPEQICVRYGKTIPQLGDVELQELHGIYMSIRDNLSGVADWFPEAVAPAQPAAINNLNNKAAAELAPKAAAKTKPAPAPEPAPQQAPEPAIDADDFPV